MNLPLKVDCFVYFKQSKEKLEDFSSLFISITTSQSDNKIAYLFFSVSRFIKSTAIVRSIFHITSLPAEGPKFELCSTHARTSCTLKTGIPVEEGDSFLKLLRRVSRPEID